MITHPRMLFEVKAIVFLTVRLTLCDRSPTGLRVITIKTHTVLRI